MNRIARTLTNLTIATGMATAALSTGVAHAETPPAPKPGPVIVLPPADPGPKGPGEIAVPEPGPVDPTDGPDDIKAPAPKPQPPKGPKDLSNGDSDPVIDPKPQPADHSAPAGTTTDQGCFEGCDLPELPATDGVKAVPVEVDPIPTVDTLGSAQVESAGPESADVALVDAGDSDYLLWLLAGLGTAGLAGIVVVAARRRSRTATEA